MKNISQLPKINRGLLLLILVGLLAFAGWAGEDPLYEESYLLPPESIQNLLVRDTNTVTLDNLSPDGDHFLIPVNRAYSTLKLMTQRTLRLGMLEICPDVNREWRLSTSGVTGLKIYSLKQKKTWALQVPANAFFSDMVWSPDGDQIAFLAHLPEGSQVWTADIKSGKSKPLSKAFVMATLTGTRSYRSSGTSRMLQWTTRGSVITLLVPENRGPEPKEPSVPATPIIRHTREKATQTSTYPFLLRTPYDKDLLEYYTTAQMAELVPGKRPRTIGEPAMYTSLALSPDGNFVLAEKMTRPFSYIVEYSGFPSELQVMDLEGNVLSTIRKDELQEGSRDSDDDPGADLPRSVSWRPDGKGLSFLWREPKKKKDEDEDKDAAEDTEEQDERMDRLMWLDPPFDLEKAAVLVVGKKRFGDVSYSADGHYAFARISGRGEDGKTGTDIAAFDLTQSPAKKILLLEKIETKDPLKLPGDIITERTSNGVEYALTSDGNGHIYLSGRGYNKEFKPRPFVDRVALAGAVVERVFEGAAEMYERPLVFTDRDLTTMIFSRESATDFPDSWMWAKGQDPIKLTDNKDPYPEFLSSKREYFEFKRRDGMLIYGKISLPPDYEPGTRVPAVFWTYPSEYTSFQEYKKSAYRSRNLNAYPRFSSRNASDIWLSQGYAVVVPDIPIIGKGNTANNNFVAHLVDSMYAAIRKTDELGYVDIDRLGHGGHSYGAFATANILAHSPFFKAGIAGDGAYNRTLTPMTFQRERRVIWEAPNVYLEMSPFFEADHIDTPLLMYHGAADNNTGTFLIQSERFMQALTGLGKNAVLYIYPFESHGPRCLETYMDMWARWLEFFDRYVKGKAKE